MHFRFKEPAKIIALIMTVSAGACGQTRAQSDIGVVTKETGKSFPIPGSMLLWKQEEQLRSYLKSHPEELTNIHLKKTSSWNFHVNDTHSWYAHDFPSNTEYEVQSTCRGVGAHCYVFVEDSMWTNGRVTQAVVDSVIANFDNRTPANSSKGIYQTDVETFGQPPDVDGDSLIIILILNIMDGWTGSGGYVAGYFYSKNELNVSQSNMAEIYFLDADPANLTTADGLRDGMSTTAHEFQHMIHWNYDQNELTFINEGCSTFAEVNCGFPIYEQSYFAGEPNHYLLDWRGNDNVAVLNDYARAARFMTYIRDQVGVGVFRPIVASKLTGIAGLNAGLSNYGSSLTFDDIFRNWSVANILDDRSVNPAYGYIYPNLQKVSGSTFINPVASRTDVISHLGNEYLIYKGGKNLAITFSTTNPAIIVKAVEKSSGPSVVADVTPGTEFDVPDYGTTYSEVDFIVTNTSYTTDYSVTFNSTGSVTPTELKWDDTEPVGYFSTLSTSDTECVSFDGVNGGILDSIRIALRRAGSITGGVWSFTGDTRPSPLGTKLSPQFTATIATTSPVPYPVPYANWTSVNLDPYSIDVSSPFAVGLVVGSDPTTPGLMITEYASTSGYHSYTYEHSSSAGANWYILTNSTYDTSYIYLIRAYVSFLTPVREPIVLTPRTFSVNQNYPNPFNPSTVISYRLPAISDVSISVYDLLGREVKILVNERQSPGEHHVQFDGNDLPSGVYIYTVRAGGTAQSHKMVLIR